VRDHPNGGHRAAREQTLGERYRAEADAAQARGERFADEAPRPTPLWTLLSRWLLGLEAWLRSHGGSGLRWATRGFWAAVAAAGLVLLLGPVINPPLTLDDITRDAQGVTDRWIARDFSADYALSRSEDGRLRVGVTERIDAFFPEGLPEQDARGIQRVLATQYQGHDLAPAAISATVDGRPLDVGRSATADRLTLTLDAGAGTLTGDHVFVLRYELSDLAYPAEDEASGQSVDLLKWDVFGPSWPQGLAALHVSLSLPAELDAQLIRQPRGDVAWTLVGDGSWLSPEDDSPPGTTRYSFDLDQNVPPHAAAWFTLSFAPGTFAMPPLTPLFWLQSLGPLLPLAVLLALLLFALAARAVAWSDARGRPWYVAQYEPPDGVSPAMAAQILARPRAALLAGALARLRGARGAEREQLLLAAARTARRTGRVGDLPRVWAAWLAAPERRAVLHEGWRRIPRGFVRDFFLAAPIALTLLQWGLVRQLSHQATLAVVWWPVVFVLVSTAVALVVLAIALSRRPLTGRGALAKQHLLGAGVFAQSTGMLQRGPVTEPLLPYAVLLAPARQAGGRMVALLEAELGQPGASRRRWRTPDFLSWPRLIVRLLSPLLVVGAIVLAPFAPGMLLAAQRPVSPWSGSGAADANDSSGMLWATVTGFDATATLSRGPDRRAQLEVTERTSVSFEDDAPSIPQFARQWPARQNGQDLDLTIGQIRVDGQAVPFSTERAADTVIARTQLAQVLTGSHEVEVDYRLGSAAFAAEDSAGAPVDRVWWAALLDGWDSETPWSSDDGAGDGVRIAVRVTDELAKSALRAGWITHDYTRDSEPLDRGDAVIAFGGVAALEPAGTAAAESGGGGQAQEQSAAAGELRSEQLALRADAEGYYGPSELTVDDLGAAFDFPRGTFAGPDPGALVRARWIAATPLALTLLLAVIALALALAGIVAGALRSAAVFRGGLFRDLVRWLMPAAAIGAIVLGLGTSAEMDEEDPTLPLLLLSAAAPFVAGIVALVLTRRGRAGERG